VVFQRQLAVGCFQFVVGGIAADIQNFVIIPFGTHMRVRLSSRIFTDLDENTVKSLKAEFSFHHGILELWKDGIMGLKGYDPY
jgi:hypothetical protein